MGCIHCSKISPEVRNQDTTVEKTTRRGGVWSLIRNFRKNKIRPMTKVIDNDIPQENLTPWQNDIPQGNLAPWHNDLPQENLAPWQNDLPQENLAPWQNDIPQENLAPWHYDIPEENLTPWHYDIPEEILTPWHYDIPEEILTPWQINELQDNLDSSQSDHVLHVVPQQNDEVENNLGLCQSDVLPVTLQKINLQLGQQPGEEASAILSDEEVDHAQETASDSLCEAGPLEQSIVNGYLDGILPSCRDEDNREETESRPVDSLQQHTSTSNKLQSILKRPGSVVPGRKSKKRVSFSASTMDVKTPGPDNTSEMPGKLLVKIPSCGCVGCRTGCEEANPSNGSNLTLPKIRLVLPRPPRVQKTARKEFQSVQVQPNTGRQESSAAYKKPVSKASCSREWEPTYSFKIPTFNPHWNCPHDWVNKRRKKALEKIKSLGEPTLVEKYAKLHSNKGFLLGD